MNNIYTVGGTIAANSDALYIRRQADQELLSYCRKGMLAYVLTARQLGKSSLMVQTAHQLKQEGRRCAIVDLTLVGTEVTNSTAWYSGILELIESDFGLEIDILQWWEDNERLPSTQRFVNLFKDVITSEISEPVVIFFDEIDTTLSLSFTDDFFAAIRGLYNARAHIPALRRVTFVLIGTTTPSDLIDDSNRTPFNIGKRVDLTDFTPEEAKPLVDGLNLPDRETKSVLRQILKWTDGHPYLTQRVCSVMAEQSKKKWSEAGIEQVVKDIFFGEQSLQDSNLRFVRDMLLKRIPKPLNVVDVLSTYQTILLERKNIQDDAQSLVKNHLKLSGVVYAKKGQIRVRNRIYKEIFDQQWIKKQWPLKELQLQTIPNVVNPPQTRSKKIIILTIMTILFLILGFSIVQFLSRFFPPIPVTITISSSNTKEKWLEEVIERFHEEGHTTNANQPIVVEVEHVASGDSMTDILENELTPVVWSPGDQSWSHQLNDAWELKHGEGEVLIKNIESNCQATAYAPIGIAMSQPMAKTLGWPEPVSWNKIIDLANDEEGWQRYDRPEWGPFRFGHPHPSYSNNALLFMSSFVYINNGKSYASIFEGNAEEAMRSLENNTARYGRLSLDLLNQMVKQGPGYLDAVVAAEAQVLEYNHKHGQILENNRRFAFVFPQEGTIWANHPYCILDDAEWVNSEQEEAAAIFRDYLLEPEQQELALDYYLRPIDETINLPFTEHDGTNPKITQDIVPDHPRPDAETSNAIKELFLKTKRKATIIILLDVSHSMGGKKIKTATKATSEFIDRLDPHDKVTVWPFNKVPSNPPAPQPVRDISEELKKRVLDLNLAVRGNTYLYDTICEAKALIDKLKDEDKAQNESRLYGIVLLSDGEDTASDIGRVEMLQTCLPNNPEVDGLKVFPIAFSQEVDQELLKEIADRTAGRLFEADPDSISDVYITISAEQ